jgi:hypothetical protein
LEPVVTLVVSDGSLEFAVSYVVDYTNRTAMKDQLFTKIVEEVANSNGRLEWAPTTLRSPPSRPFPPRSRRNRLRRPAPRAPRDRSPLPLFQVPRKPSDTVTRDRRGRFG